MGTALSIEWKLILKYTTLNLGRLNETGRYIKSETLLK